MSQTRHLFGQRAVAAGYVSDQQVRDALAEQARAINRRELLRLGEVMVRKGWMTPAQVLEVLKGQAVQIYRARSGHQFNVSDPDPRSDYFSPLTGDALAPVTPDQIANVRVEGLLHPSMGGEAVPRGKGGTRVKAGNPRNQPAPRVQVAPRGALGGTAPAPAPTPRVQVAPKGALSQSTNGGASSTAAPGKRTAARQQTGRHQQTPQTRRRPAAASAQASPAIDEQATTPAPDDGSSQRVPQTTPWKKRGDTGVMTPDQLAARSRQRELTPDRDEDASATVADQPAALFTDASDSQFPDLIDTKVMAAADLFGDGPKPELLKEEPPPGWTPPGTDGETEAAASDEDFDDRAATVSADEDDFGPADRRVTESIGDSGFDPTTRAITGTVGDAGFTDHVSTRRPADAPDAVPDDTPVTEEAATPTVSPTAGSVAIPGVALPSTQGLTAPVADERYADTQVDLGDVTREARRESERLRAVRDASDSRETTHEAFEAAAEDAVAHDSAFATRVDAMGSEEVNEADAAIDDGESDAGAATGIDAPLGDVSWGAFAGAVREVMSGGARQTDDDLSDGYSAAASGSHGALPLAAYARPGDGGSDEWDASSNATTYQQADEPTDGGNASSAGTTAGVVPATEPLQAYRPGDTHVSGEEPELDDPWQAAIAEMEQRHSGDDLATDTDGPDTTDNLADGAASATATDATREISPAGGSDSDTADRQRFRPGGTDEWTPKILTDKLPQKDGEEAVESQFSANTSMTNFVDRGDLDRLLDESESLVGHEAPAPHAEAHHSGSDASTDAPDAADLADSMADDDADGATGDGMPDHVAGTLIDRDVPARTDVAADRMGTGHDTVLDDPPDDIDNIDDVGDTPVDPAATAVGGSELWDDTVAGEDMPSAAESAEEEIFAPTSTDQQVPTGDGATQNEDSDIDVHVPSQAPDIAGGGTAGSDTLRWEDLHGEGSPATDAMPGDTDQPAGAITSAADTPGNGGRVPFVSDVDIPAFQMPGGASEPATDPEPDPHDAGVPANAWATPPPPGTVSVDRPAGDVSMPAAAEERIAEARGSGEEPLDTAALQARPVSVPDGSATDDASDRSASSDAVAEREPTAAPEPEPADAQALAARAVDQVREAGAADAADESDSVHAAPTEVDAQLMSAEQTPTAGQVDDKRPRVYQPRSTRVVKRPKPKIIRTTPAAPFAELKPAEPAAAADGSGSDEFVELEDGTGLPLWDPSSTNVTDMPMSNPELATDRSTDTWFALIDTSDTRILHADESGLDFVLPGSEAASATPPPPAAKDDDGWGAPTTTDDDDDGWGPPATPAELAAAARFPAAAPPTDTGSEAGTDVSTLFPEVDSDDGRAAGESGEGKSQAGADGVPDAEPHGSAPSEPVTLPAAAPPVSRKPRQRPASARLPQVGHVALPDPAGLREMLPNLDPDGRMALLTSLLLIANTHRHNSETGDA